MRRVFENLREKIQQIVKDIGNERGFSLLELLIVLVIIGILGAIVYTKFTDLPEKAKIEATKQQMLVFKMSLDRYKLDNDSYPTTDQGLQAVKQYLDAGDIPNDPWGNPYIYRSPGENNDYEIISLGPDKQENTTDDIKSYELHKVGKFQKSSN